MKTKLRVHMTYLHNLTQIILHNLTHTYTFISLQGSQYWSQFGLGSIDQLVEPGGIDSNLQVRPGWDMRDFYNFIRIMKIHEVLKQMASTCYLLCIRRLQALPCLAWFSFSTQFRTLWNYDDLCASVIHWWHSGRVVLKAKLAAKHTEVLRSAETWPAGQLCPVCRRSKAATAP